MLRALRSEISDASAPLGDYRCRSHSQALVLAAPLFPKPSGGILSGRAYYFQRADGYPPSKNSKLNGYVIVISFVDVSDRERF
jgi:hypothetical protein